MKFRKDMLLLYGITDQRWADGQTLYEQVEAALQGGATMIQLREKQLDEEAFLQEAKVIRDSVSYTHLDVYKRQVHW